MTDQQLVALMAAILIGKTEPGVFINEKEAVADAVAILAEVRRKRTA